MQPRNIGSGNLLFCSDIYASEQLFKSTTRLRCEEKKKGKKKKGWSQLIRSAIRVST
jgi:hypothetical protein